MRKSGHVGADGQLSNSGRIGTFGIDCILNFVFSPFEQTKSVVMQLANEKIMGKHKCPTLPMAYSKNGIKKQTK